MKRLLHHWPICLLLIVDLLFMFDHEYLGTSFVVIVIAWVFYTERKILRREINRLKKLNNPPTP